MAQNISFPNIQKVPKPEYEYCKSLISIKWLLINLYSFQKYEQTWVFKCLFDNGTGKV